MQLLSTENNPFQSFFEQFEKNFSFSPFGSNTDFERFIKETVENSMSQFSGNNASQGNRMGNTGDGMRNHSAGNTQHSQSNPDAGSDAGAQDQSRRQKGSQAGSQARAHTKAQQQTPSQAQERAGAGTSDHTRKLQPELFETSDFLIVKVAAVDSQVTDLPKLYLSSHEFVLNGTADAPPVLRFYLPKPIVPKKSIAVFKEDVLEVRMKKLKDDPLSEIHIQRAE